jgi:hypothetical protein
VVREQTFALPARTPAPASAPGVATAAEWATVIVNAPSRWRAASDWLGIVTGAAVFRRHAGRAA